MSRMILARLASALTLMIMASMLSFLLILAAPGNVAVVMAEAQAAYVSKEAIEAIEREHGFNDPVYIRYARWLVDSLEGNFGHSLRTGEDVAESFYERLPLTATLVAGGGVAALVIGLGLGLTGAVFAGSPVDKLTRSTALLAASTPTFFVGALLILLFGVILHLLPTYGFRGPSSWVLPSLTIGFVPGALLSRVTRVALEDAMTRPHISTAMSKGFGRRRILIRDALPNVAPTLITTFGLKFALMIQGAIVVEIVFSWPGIASYFVEAVRFRDLPVIQAGLLLFTVFFVLVNLVVDLIVAAVDPKQKLARA
jgi:peptide/nickel transport system permease protein